MKTRTISTRRPLALLTGLALLLGGAAAQAETPTVITALPYVISTSGTYVLNDNLGSSQTTGSLIDIQANNVTIDFQNHYIAGAVNNTTQTTIGVYALERSNVTVKNGTVAYCNIGLYLAGNGSTTTNSVDHQIDNMRVTYCYKFGIFASYSPASRVTNCQVSQCGLNGASNTVGIFANGPGTTVQGNVVSTVAGPNSACISSNPNSFVRQNTVSGAVYGIYGGKYQDNLTANCTNPYVSGTDAGGNN